MSSGDIKKFNGVNFQNSNGRLEAAVQSDGRSQLYFYTGSDTHVVEFSEDGVIKEVMSPSGGWTFDTKKKVVVEIDNVSEFTAPATSATGVTLTHSKTGYACYYLNFYEYRTNASWFIHVKDMSNGNVVLDYVNTSASAITVSSAKVAWLCLPT